MGVLLGTKLPSASIGLGITGEGALPCAGAVGAAGVGATGAGLACAAGLGCAAGLAD